MALSFKTCLLIDDNYIDNFVTRKILEGSNFAESIIVVRSANEAIESLPRRVDKAGCNFFGCPHAFDEWV